MQIEDTDIFEITDFTNATNWEVFISRLEDIITSIENVQLTEESDSYPVQTVIFQKFKLNIGLVAPKTLLLDGGKLIEDGNNYEISQSLLIKEKKMIQSEFEHSVDWDLIKWFGKLKYIIIVPYVGTSIYGHEQLKQLMNSVMIAVANIKCQLPVVIKYGSKNWALYEGVLLDCDFKTKLQSASIKHAPKQCRYLSGIRRMFQEKLGKGSVLDDDTAITAKYLFVIDNNPHQNPRYFKGLITKKKAMNYFQYLTLGFAKDPVKQIKLYAHWPRVPNHILCQLDGPHLPVSTANMWYMLCDMESSFDGIHYKTLRKLLKAFLVAEKPTDIVRDSKLQELDSVQINQPLLKLTQPPISHKIAHQLGRVTPALTSSANRSPSHSNNSSPLNDKMVQTILEFLFPDVPRPTSPPVLHHPYQFTFLDKLPNVQKVNKRFPSANISSSLFHRISICLTNLLSQHKDGLKCLSYVWNEVLLELRYRFEHAIPFPETRQSEEFDRLKSQDDDDEEDSAEEAECKDELYATLLQRSMPHLAETKVEQRMHLINYCILARLRHEFLRTAPLVDATSSSVEDTSAPVDFDSVSTAVGDGNGEEEEETFFDCPSDEEQSPRTIDNEVEPRGRLRQCGHLCLLKRPGVSLYVPVTQVLPVRCVGDHDNDSDGSTASLVADMSAFKAANPGGCVMEDFIRWYSPRDFVCSTDAESTAKSVSAGDDGSSGGGLSGRMRVIDNAWQRCWTKAVPQPARAQRRLFDETSAAEAAFHWLQQLTIAELASSVINYVLVDSLYAVVDCLEDTDSPDLFRQVDDASVLLLRFLESMDPLDVTGAELEYYQAYDEMITLFQRLEFSLAIKTSLHTKFFRDSGTNCHQLINRVVSGSTDEVPLVPLARQSSNQTSGTSRQSSALTTLCDMYRLSHMLPSPQLQGQHSVATSRSELDMTFTEPDQSEYVLGMNCPCPLNSSRSSAQRLYVCNNDTEFRIASLFNEDVTYF